MYEPSNPQADSAVEHRQVDQALFYIMPGLFARSRSRGVVAKQACTRALSVMRAFLLAQCECPLSLRRRRASYAARSSHERGVSVCLSACV